MVRLCWNNHSHITWIWTGVSKDFIPPPGFYGLDYNKPIYVTYEKDKVKCVSDMWEFDKIISENG